MQTQGILWMACSFTRYWNDSQIWLFNRRRTCQEGGGNIGHADFKNTSVFPEPFQRVCFLPPKFLNPGMLRMLVGISPITQFYGLHITGQGCNLGITGSDSLGCLTWSVPNYTLVTSYALPFMGFLTLYPMPSLCTMDPLLATKLVYPVSQRQLARMPASEQVCKKVVWMRGREKHLKYRSRPG